MSAATDTLNLDDLDAWSFDGVALAVVGHPIAHSLSPVIHNAALAQLARTDAHFSKWRYFKFDIEPDELPAALQEFHKQKFRGLNFTVPHKTLVIPFLEKSDSFVQAAGAANTLTYSKDGWNGANTDGYGLSEALHERFGVGLGGADVILLGAGGAGRAAATQCIRDNCASLWIGNRTKELRDRLVSDLQSANPSSVSDIRPFSLKNLRHDRLPKNAIVINATSLGLKPDDDAPVDLKEMPTPRCVFDMIYRPAQTALLRTAAQLGIAQANGLGMLVHQGARSLSIWTGATVPVAAMQAAAAAALPPS